MHMEDCGVLREIMTGLRQAALGTVANGTPAVSMVLYALERTSEAAPAPLIHVSRLAAHTRQLQFDPRASLLIMQPDVGAVDPQRLARVTLQGQAQAIHRDDSSYAAAKAAYIERLPDQAYLFDFADFTLFRLMPETARFIRGFGRAFTLDSAALAAVFAAASSACG